ncbi:MAG: cation:proton antiporter [Anaerolineales bacterium]|jgi:Kef-type K+ transport system membrane component KefB
MLETILGSLEIDILGIIGFMIAAAFLGSKLFQRVGIPQVVGFIVLGVIMGPSLLNIVPLELSSELAFISEIALGLIGFDIGSHLLLRDLRRLGRSILFILVFESIGTFLVVGLGIYLLTGAFEIAMMFGALASATAPAATVDVLAEYNAKGPLTTSLLAVVGLDDALALILYSLAAVVVETSLSGGPSPSLFELLRLPLYEIGGSIVVGAGLAVALDIILCRMKKKHDAMAVSMGFVILGVGISETFGLSLIFTAMIMGTVLVNRNRTHSEHIHFTIQQTGPVFYVLFFSLIGARLQISQLPAMGAIGMLYIVLRSGAKYAGAWLGGRIGGAVETVRNNLGFGLLSQAGVAVGLALASQARFAELGAAGEAMGTMILSVITATTFVVQIIGPIATKFAIFRAGEAGKTITDHEIWEHDTLLE